MRKRLDELKLTGRLPTPSGVALAILQQTRDDSDATTDEIARTLQGDPALTGRILKMANSARQGAAEPVVTVDEAVIRLGSRSVRSVALGFSLVSAYRHGACERFDYDRFWSEALLRGVAARVGAERLGGPPPPEAYVCGLLSDIGRLALASVHPIKYSAVIAEVRRQRGDVLADAERRRLGIDHREIGEALLLDWGLSESHASSIARHETEDRGDDSISRLLSFSGRCAAVAMSRRGVSTAAWDAYESTAAEIGIPSEDLRALGDEILKEWRSCAETISVDTTGVDTFADIVVSARVSDGSHIGSRPMGSTEAGEGERIRVLAVDDESISLRILARCLEKAGYEVFEASDGHEALALALEVNPHVVVSDWMMPEMDGIELCQSLRRCQTTQSVYVVLLTGREDEDRVVEAFDAGVNDYVTKPFNPKVLLARVGAGERVVRLQEQVTRDQQRVSDQFAELSVLNRRLEEASLTDPLTGLGNRRHAMNRLAESWERFARNDIPYSVIMIDIDNFKNVNDEHGHDIGDAVLKAVSTIFNANCRKTDIPFRMGGEEFLVVSDAMTVEQVTASAERLRAAVEATEMRSGSFSGHVTISLGIAVTAPGIDSVDALLKAADEAVYEAKTAGRNRICTANSSILTP